MKIKKIEHFAYLAIIAAALTIFFKSAAYLITGSVGLLSDAIESLVNLATAFITLYAIKFSLEPEDTRHQFGHSKIEYFSSLAESLFIFIAAIIIILSGIERLIHPSIIEEVGLGITISCIASIINAYVAYQLFQGSKKYNSIALKADAHHLLTDVYTSIAIVVSVAVVYFTKIYIFDPIIAIIVGLNILRTAYCLAQKSFHGLIDECLEEDKIKLIEHEISKILKENNATLLFKLKSRVSGQKTFLYLTLAIDDSWSIKKAHNITYEIEKYYKNKDENIKLFIHTEPVTDFLHD